MGIRARVSRWRNSLAVRLPRAVTEQMGVEEGAEVEIIARGGQVVLRKPAYTLAGLLESVTAGNRHGELDTGPAAWGRSGSPGVCPRARRRGRARFHPPGRP